MQLPALHARYILCWSVLNWWWGSQTLVSSSTCPFPPFSDKPEQTRLYRNEWVDVLCVESVARFRVLREFNGVQVAILSSSVPWVVVVVEEAVGYQQDYMHKSLTKRSSSFEIICDGLRSFYIDTVGLLSTMSPHQGSVPVYVSFDCRRSSSLIVDTVNCTSVHANNAMDADIKHQKCINLHVCGHTHKGCDASASIQPAAHAVRLDTLMMGW